MTEDVGRKIKSSRLYNGINCYAKWQTEWFVF